MKNSADPIATHLLANRSFVLPLLLNTYARLCVLQMSKGSFVYQDVVKNVNLSAGNLTADELNAHAALLYEAVLMPCYKKEKMILKVIPELMADDSKFVVSLIEVLKSRSGDTKECLALAQLKKEAAEFLNDPRLLAPSVDPTENSSGASTVSSKSESLKGHAVPEILLPASSPPTLSPNLPPTAGDTSNNFTDSFSVTTTSPNVAPTLPANYAHSSMIPASIIGMRDSDNGDPSVRLILAEIRQIGMEILFPQAVHDKVLAALFVAVRSVPVISYRELLDMVMAVKDANIISNLEFVSKSKVRGMLSLLKHCHVLLTQVKGPGEQPGYLYLAQAVTSFQVMRDWHDDYLLKFMQKLPLTLPESFITEMVWRYNDQEKFLRLEAVEKLMHKLSSFFTGYLNNINNKPAMYQNSMVNKYPMSIKPGPQALYPAQPMNGGYPLSRPPQQYDNDEDSNWSSRKPTNGHHQPDYSTAPMGSYRGPHGYAPPPRGSATYGYPRDSAPQGYNAGSSVHPRYQEQGYGGSGSSRYHQQAPTASAYPPSYPPRRSEANVPPRRSTTTVDHQSDGLIDSFPQQLGSTRFNEALDAFDGRSAQSYTAAPQQLPLATQRRLSKPSFQGLLSSSLIEKSSVLGGAVGGAFDSTDELSRSFFSGTRVNSELTSVIDGELEPGDLRSNIRLADRSGAGRMEVRSNSSNLVGGFESTKLSVNAPAFSMTKPASAALPYTTVASPLSSGFPGSTIFHDTWGNGDAWPAGNN